MIRTNEETIILLEKLRDDTERIIEKVKSGEPLDSDSILVDLLVDKMEARFKGREESDMTHGEQVMKRMATVARSYADVAKVEQLNNLEKDTIDNLRKR